MKKLAVLVAGLGIVSGLYAQQIPQYSQYYINPFIYNPGFAGSSENVSAYLIHRSQFQSFQGAPVTNAFTIDGPLKEKNIGLGLSLFNDGSDMINRMGVKSAYSYRLQLPSDMQLRFGLALGVSETRIDFSKAIVRDLNDPFVMKQVERRVNVDADFGTVFNWKDLEATIAVPQLLESKAKFISNETRTVFQAKRHFLGSVKYTFDVIKDKGITAYPLVLVRYAPGMPFSYDINAVAEWEDKGWFGVSYKNDYAIGINLGVRLNKSLAAGYTYDIITSPVKSYSGMSHEILLGYTFGGRKEEVVPEQPAAQADNQRITDLEGVVNDQKKQIAINKAEIDSLKKAIGSGAAAMKTDSGVVKDLRSGQGFITVGLTADYIDREGKRVKPGHYIVTGSFSVAENADKALIKIQEIGYKNATYIKNIKTNVIYVYVSMTQDASSTMTEELAKVRKDIAPDSWIYHLED